MDLQQQFDIIVKAKRKESFDKSDQLSLGEMILKLEPIVEKQKQRIAENKTEATVQYDFEYLYPTSINSWRGSYAELALNFVTDENEYKPMTVTEFLALLRGCVGKEFTGYKGGEFIMTKNTPVWVANFGNSGNTAVIDIIDNNYSVIIITGHREF